MGAVPASVAGWVSGQGPDIELHAEGAEFRSRWFS